MHAECAWTPCFHAPVLGQNQCNSCRRCCCAQQLTLCALQLRKDRPIVAAVMNLGAALLLLRVAYAVLWLLVWQGLLRVLGFVFWTPRWWLSAILSFTLCEPPCHCLHLAPAVRANDA